jgi:hypothetical protein
MVEHGSVASLDQYNPKNPLNLLNEYNPSTSFNPLNR